MVFEATSQGDVNLSVATDAGGGTLAVAEMVVHGSTFSGPILLLSSADNVPPSTMIALSPSLDATGIASAIATAFSDVGYTATNAANVVTFARNQAGATTDPTIALQVVGSSNLTNGSFVLLVTTQGVDALVGPNLDPTQDTDRWRVLISGTEGLVFNDTMNVGTTLGVDFTDTSGTITATVDASGINAGHVGATSTIIASSTAQSVDQGDIVVDPSTTGDTAYIKVSTGAVMVTLSTDFSDADDWLKIDDTDTQAIPSGATLPTTGLATGQVFLLTATDGSNAPGLYRYSGTAWVAYTTTVPATTNTIDFDSGTRVLTSTVDGVADTTTIPDTAASLSISAWPGSFQSNFNVPIGSYWSRTVASQLRVYQYTGHQTGGLDVTSSNFSDYVPQSTEEFWTEVGSENAASIWPTTFNQLFFRNIGQIWSDGTGLYLSNLSAAIHDEQTRSDNAPATGASGWTRLDMLTGGGITAVTSDDTLRGGGTGANDRLSVSRLQQWATGTAYVLGDMVVDNFDYQIYKANVANIPAVMVTTLPTVQRVSFGTATGFTELRYLVEFVGTNPTIDPAQTYDFSIGGTGAAINVNFTVLGSDISTTDLSGFWVISPTATSYTVVSGATPTVRTSNPLTNISISLGTTVANPRPGLDPTRWIEVSNTGVTMRLGTHPPEENLFAGLKVPLSVLDPWRISSSKTS